MIPTIRTDPTHPPVQVTDRPFREQAGALEALLFTQVLRSAGTAGSAFHGRDGPFHGMLRDAQAAAVAASGQAGLALSIERSLMRRSG
jgi:hypothetical protein